MLDGKHRSLLNAPAARLDLRSFRAIRRLGRCDGGRFFVKITAGSALALAAGNHLDVVRDKMIRAVEAGQLLRHPRVPDLDI
jgi:hypothetical protein